MQDLINKIVAEAGVNPEQAAKALTTVVNHVKSLLPPAFAGNIDKLMASGSDGIAATAASLSASAEPAKEASMMDKASDLAGDAKDKLADMAGDAKEKISQFMDKDNLDAMKEKAGDKLDELEDKAEQMAKDAIDKIKGIFGK
jgi:gas vesicle protein